MNTKKSMVGWVLAALIVVGVAVYIGRQTSTPAAEKEEDSARENTDKKTRTTTASRDKKKARSKERMEKARELRELLKRSSQNQGDQNRDKRDSVGIEIDTSQISNFDPVQQHALTLAFESVYDPTALKEALEDGSVIEYMKETSTRLKQMAESATIEVSQAEIPVTEEMQLALDRMRLLNRYTANIAHAMRPGDLEVQNRHILRINRSFKERFEILNQYYPFLNAEMVTP